MNMKSRLPNTEAFARKMLDRLIELDYQTVEAYYEMGSIISSMVHGRLFEVIGYPSMASLIEEELTFSPTTGLKYSKMYRRFRQLKYSKAEAIELLREFGLTHMSAVLPDMKDKIGSRAIRNRIEALDDHQINFTLNGHDLRKVNAALKKMGGEQFDEGRWKNSSEAFMRMVRAILKK
jgi:hypothetical protein